MGAAQGAAAVENREASVMVEESPAAVAPLDLAAETGTAAPRVAIAAAPTAATARPVAWAHLEAPAAAAELM